MEVTTKPGGGAYAGVLKGEGHARGQVMITPAACAAFKDADGMLPPGLMFTAAGAPAHDADTKAINAAVHGVLASPVKLNATDKQLVGLVLSNGVRKAAVQDNLGHALTAPELAFIPARIIMQ